MSTNRRRDGEKPALPPDPNRVLINELITNIFKHGFKDKDEGIIRINVNRPDTNILEIAIEDNGQDYIKEKTKNTGESLGLVLITALVSQLTGQWEQYKPDNGGWGTLLTIPIHSADYSNEEPDQTLIHS